MFSIQTCKNFVSSQFFSHLRIDPAQVDQYRELLNSTVEQGKHEEAVLKKKLEEEERALSDNLNRLREEWVLLEQKIRNQESSLASSIR